MLVLLFQSIIIGLAIAAPIGPVSIICIRTTIAQGIMPGLAVGAGATLGAAMYGLAAGLSLAAVTSLLQDIHFYLKFGGGLFILYLGITFLFKKAHYSRGQIAGQKQFGKTFGSGFFLTLTSPMAILSFVGVMSALEVEAKSKIDALTLMLGVLIGSAVWWLFLVAVVSLTAKRLSEKVLNYINRASGVILILFATYILCWV